MIILLLGALLAPGCESKPAQPAQATFKTPEEAAQALVGALDPLDKSRLSQILGPESDDLVSSGDDVADRNAFTRFVEAYRAKHEIVTEPDGARTLQVGTLDWPLPIPLVQEGGNWVFDSDSGKEEILNRRIGRNELSTIQTCLAVVDAQREYASADPDGNGVHEYAQKFLSDAGKRNGLYWPTKDGEPQSPMGAMAAEAEAEGYALDPGKGTASERAFHGYHFRLLKGQGPGAKGGAYDYMVNGRLMGGFALIAWPASYQNSGVMSFMTSHDGVVYEKDLGAETDKLAKAMALFDPADGWKPVKP